MPPRAVKKASGGASAVKKTSTRTAKGAPKSQAAVEEVTKVEEVTVSTIVEVKEEIKVEEVKPEEKLLIQDSKTNGSVDAQDVHEEEDKGERLELEDNEPEYEPEEDAVVDYDERNMEHGDGLEVEGDEGEEDGEEGGEEEADMVDEEMEDGGEDVEGEEEEHEVDREEEEHHEVVKEHRKRKEFEVFVGGLDKDATEDDLKKVFSVVGEITEVRLMMNPQSKKNKGFAFLRFATVEQAKRAVSELKESSG